MEQQLTLPELTNRLRTQSTKNNLVRFFPKSDLRCGHKGLRELARSHGVTLSELGRGDFLLFTNKAMTAAKYLGSDGLMLHLKLDKSKVLTPANLSALPQRLWGPSFGLSRTVVKEMRSSFPAWFKDKKVS